MIKFATVRLGKTSVDDIKRINSLPSGILSSPIIVPVICTQVPIELETNTIIFLWFGSDNAKGMPTEWKQGFKAVGTVVEIIRGASFNSETTTKIRIEYVFSEAINRLDILRDASSAYYNCANLPIIGIDDHSNQTIRIIDEKQELGDSHAFLYALNKVHDTFKTDICQIHPELTEYFYYYDKRIEKYVGLNVRQSISETSYLPYLTALRTKPFMLLAGISGTGKSRIVRKLAQATNTKEYANEEDRWKDNRPDNFQLIQVKPNWHNSMDVAGFLSNIPTPHYVFTDFVRFIVKAWQHPETPYFLCLDEMNLAPVEEYFAEFLSAIESRAWDENGHYTTDPIISPFKDFGKEVCEAMLKELLGEARHTEANPLAIQFEEKGLTLPPNLMVMGTVNMDETTFSFSRKVLDRAMSVEMNEVKYDDFLDGKTELMPLLTEWNEKLVNRPQKAQEVQGEIDSQKVIDYLKAVNELLDSTPFKLGYRAANEAILYVAASQEFAQGTFSLEKALDEFTLMKILSRIEGDDSRLAIDEKDERLQAAGIDGNAMDDGEQSLYLLNCLRAIVRKHIGQGTETEKKINRMYNTLLREHFVSYWG